tara:strand:- start:434 stop:637 length:204 start_codon:yes stop_codon:yes gene_type:complete
LKELQYKTEKKEGDSMELEFQVQMKNDPVDINIVTANNETDLQEVIDQFIQDCKHIEKVTVADMEVK